jgi:conjugal transfer pilus assembly protein TraF
LSIASAQAAGAAPPKKASQAAPDDPSRFINERERGWHWYEDPPPEPEPVDPTQPPPAASPPGPPPLSIQWLKVEMEKAKEVAIDNPTRENVEYYNYLQKIAMDKAEKFALMTQQVNTLNPALDESIDNPTTKYAKDANTALRDRERTQVLTTLGSEVGIYYFFKSDCPFCAKQNSLIQALQSKYGFSVLPVSLDRRPFADGSFANWVPDQGQGAALNIMSTPTIYLYRAPDKIVLLAASLQTLPELERRILQVANAHKWLSDDDFERAMRGSPRDFLVDEANAAPGVDWNNPTEALNALRAMSRQAAESSRIQTSADGTTFQATPWTGE